MTLPASAPATEFKRQLGLLDSTAIVIGSMIGSGIFMMPALLAPYGGLSFGGWLIAAGGSIAIALSIARLASRTFAHVLRLPLSFFETTTAGVLMRHIQQTETVRGFLTGRLFQTLLDLATMPVLLVGLFGVILERTMLRKLYKLDHLYGLLLTFGLALIIEGVFRDQFGISGESYEVPDALAGGINLGFMFLPIYRAWIVVVSILLCFATWFLIERTKLGSYLRATTENPTMVRAFGVNVPVLLACVFLMGLHSTLFGPVKYAYLPQQQLGGASARHGPLCFIGMCIILDTPSRQSLAAVSVSNTGPSG